MRRSARQLVIGKILREYHPSVPNLQGVMHGSRAVFPSRSHEAST
ncbi:unnamed protein product [Acanthoscelides obtectus]|uniref:Uncharacterized protein n=1 Tax=Acanthoscelides obtectus TaxID=200917 RepID=A0A9P0LD49_ACAOB|nr:unnamed protein product [Acanthoscelides obtectus]CAH2013204.1 unnamed protein product [Acanthoscelides obtectus]CAK1634488.1 hypothetical protein AOBTE_LOCUS8773 [Acanthoscelides obtectus]CAK1683994.1 hypothetical protein AOBTE_LOCUS34573 [Acanthoscelides obtectus]